MNAQGEAFDDLVQDMFDGFIERHPTLATFLGIHKYDHELPDGTPDATEKEIRLAKEFKRRFGAIDETDLDFSRKLDLRLIDDLLELWIFDMEEWGLWRMYPEGVDTLGSALFPLFVRNFAPLPERLDSIKSRLERAPVYLHQTKGCLTDPVDIYCRVALESAHRLPMFVALITRVAEEFLGNEAKALADAAEEVENALSTYRDWLEDRMQDIRGDFAIGADLLRKRLRLRGIELGLSEILELGERYLSKEKRNLAEYADRVKKGASVEEAKNQIRSNHPSDFASVLEVYKEEILKSKEFVQDSGFATIPGEEELTVVETPSFLTHVIPFAAYMTPAKFDEIQQGVYLVTPAESSEMLEEHSYASISNTCVHEGYPGHHLQNVASNQNPSLVRLLSQGTEFVEGWAHYCEEAVKEMGYADAPEHRFVQSQDLIWRAVRVIVDIKLSSGEMTFDEAVDLLIEETGMSRDAATAEVKRYTYTPGYQLSYLLGKHMIRELREETSQRLGSEFDLKAFHDTLIYAGSIPMKYQRMVVREKLRPSG